MKQFLGLFKTFLNRPHFYANYIFGGKKGPEKRERREEPCKREIFSIGQVTMS